MYAYIKHFLILFSFLFIPVGMGYGQQPTRERLLKLFYKAHTAQKENDQQAAIATYKEILKLSPGLPDPYLQLGNLYATMVEDADALKKACICYSTYLDLKPETANASALKDKMGELTRKVAELEKEHATVEVQQEVKPVPMLADSVAVAVRLKEEKMIRCCKWRLILYRLCRWCLLLYLFLPWMKVCWGVGHRLRWAMTGAKCGLWM